MGTLAQERYGRRPASRRRRLAVLVAGLLAVSLALAWIGWATLIRRPDVTWQDVGYLVTSDAQTQVTFDVSFSGRAVKRAAPLRPTAVCTVQALNTLQTEVGLRDVRVQPVGDNQVRTTLTLATSERATTGLVKACALAR